MRHIKEESEIDKELWTEEAVGDERMQTHHQQQEAPPLSAASTALAMTRPMISPPASIEKDVINIKIVDPTSKREEHFALRKMMPLGTLFQVYAQRRGVSLEKCQFLLDGQIIQPHDTRESLQLEDLDQIDCVLLL
jgi:hypothetical protein